jgi:hypothetical protein
VTGDAHVIQQQIYNPRGRRLDALTKINKLRGTD